MNRKKAQGLLARGGSLLLSAALLSGLLFPALVFALEGEETSPDENTSTQEGLNGDPASSQEPEPTLEELRDELLAIMGEAENRESVKTSIDRLIALGDPEDTLRTYLEQTIRLYQLQSEQQELENSLTQLEGMNEGLSALGEAVDSGMNPDEVLRRLESEVDAGAAQMLKDLGYDGTGELFELANAAITYLDEGKAGTQSGHMAAILLYQGLIDGEFLEEEGVEQAQKTISSHASSIAGSYQGLSSQSRETLQTQSQDIAQKANLAQAMDPSALVVAGGTLALTKPVFTYNGCIMISLTDAASFLGGQVVKMADGCTMAIQSPYGVLEVILGLGNAYWNDRLLKLEVPAILFDNEQYIPLDALLSCRGMARMQVGSVQLIYAA